MVDTAFDDFLDSDDDDLFLEASNHFLNSGTVLESLRTAKENNLQEQSKDSTSHYFRSETSVVKQNFESTNKIDLNKSEDTTKTIKAPLPSDNNSNSTIPTAERNDLQEVFKDNTSHYFNFSEKSVAKQNFTDTDKIHLNKAEDTIKTTNAPVISSGNNPSNKQLNTHENVNENFSFSATPDVNILNKTENFNHTDLKEPKAIDKNMSSLEYNTPIYSDSTKTASPDSFHINTSSRFTPGYTPKSKRRKLPGPAGFLEFLEGSKGGISSSSDKMLTMDIDFENIVSSQYTPELLSSSSWQKLQTAVSSCSNLHSTANYYSIQRVLQESAKKKLPKHMVVPLLCILLKKLNKGSAVISVFMDDTGEINGKIDSEVLSSYKEFLVEGTALILKKVTFLCNVLILKAENLVSIYHPNGTEKHPQSLESILETPEALKPMNCECLTLSLTKRILKYPDYNTSGHHRSSCISHSQNKVITASNQDKSDHKIPSNINTHNNYKSGCDIQIKDKMIIIPNQTATRSNANLISKQIPPVPENHSKILRSDAFLENLLDEDNCMDEFDELLGNLDETSFMGDA